MTDAQQIDPGSTQALTDYRVLEIGTGHAVAAAGLMFADQGAQVTRLALAQRTSRLTPAQQTLWHRGKQCRQLDLSMQHAELMALLDQADVVLHDMTPAEAARLQLTASTLSAGRPSLVIGTVTGWPETHRAADRPVSEPLVMAESGMLDEQAALHRDGPVYLRFPMASWHAAGLIVAGVLVRLLNRGVSGRGGQVNTSLMQGALVPQMMHWYRVGRTGPGMAGWPKDHPVTLFECGDGQWMHVMGQPSVAPMVGAALEAMGERRRDEANARYASVSNPFMKDWGALEDVFRTRERDVWLRHLWEHGVAVMPALEMGEILDDPQVLANGYARRGRDPVQGECLFPALPWHIAATGTSAPATGRVPGVASGALLSGIKVLDLGGYLAGPLATMLMADLAAEVIKVELPGGDPMRGVAWAFQACQRGKRGVAIQLKHAGATAVLERMIRHADVVHHNQRPSVARRLGIDADAVRRINPSAVYSHVSAYGPSGERRDWPGYDQLFQAASGWEQASGGRDNPPMWLRFGMMDHLAGLHSLCVTLVGLLARQKTGCGQQVATSLLGASVFTVETAAGQDGSHIPFSELDHEQLGISATQRLYACQDGWIVLDDGTALAATRLAQSLGCDSADQVSARFAGITVSAALALMQRAEIPAAPVKLNQGDAFLEDTGNGCMTVKMAHPDYDYLAQPGAFWHFTDASLSLGRPAPSVGQDNHAVLQALGFTEQEISTLVTQGIVSGQG